MSKTAVKNTVPPLAPRRSTLPMRAPKLGADWLVSAEAEVQDGFLEALTDEALLALPWIFEFWALPHQLPPDGDWMSWVIMGGRGAGKTRAGSEWVRSMVEGPTPQCPGRARRMCLLGETFDQVREVMIFGESGILACSPPDRRPEWQAGRRRLEWPNGAVAEAHSAHDPESLRGPQFDAAWADELAKWKRAEAAWDMLQFGLRLGDDPRQCVTTTPRNVGVLKQILAAPSTVVTSAPTEANRAHLAESFLREVRRRHRGTALERQELDGVLLEDAEGALWSRAGIAAQRLEDLPPLDRVVVAVDPAVTARAGSDACGIVVVGAQMQGPVHEWRAVVLEDASVQGRMPIDWARAVIAATERHGASQLVVEVNQGGDLIETLLRTVDPGVPYRAVRAQRGKAARAEPVAALYEQGRVRHLGVFDTLEDEMCRMTLRGYEGSGSPDRVDALVWAVHELLIRPREVQAQPHYRAL